MGLSSVASGGIILVVLVLVFMTMPKLLDSTLSLQGASTSIYQVENTISKTSISVDTLVAPTTYLNETTFTVHNTGQEKLWNFADFNVIITYNAASGEFTQSLSYAGTCHGIPAIGRWCIDSIDDDILDPDILNYGESLNVRSTVANSISSGSFIVTVGTDNGVIGTVSMTVP
ncbi:MAG TPA: hypothetical protein VLF17_05770 [Candidatus Nitrosotenuis sp.]|nr:hypothetical protein [Candidatus Nitrosotenuis sp.]